MRLILGPAYALAAMAAISLAVPAEALEVFATNIFSPVDGEDEDPSLTGLMKVDLDTGVATTFIAENAAAGFFLLTDVAVGPHDGMVYVGNQLGRVFRFNAETGQPLVTEPGGFFAQVAGAANDLEFAPDGTLYVAEVGQAGSNIAVISPQGLPQPYAVTGRTFISGIAVQADGGLFFAEGGLQDPGEIFSWDGQTATSIASSNLGGILDLTLVGPSGDYDASGATDAADRSAWASQYGAAGPGLAADGNGDGVVDAADYTIARDNDGAESKLLVADFYANLIRSYALDGSDAQFPIPFVPPAFPAELPEHSDFFSNFPSEVVLTPQDTLLVSTLGLTRRPDNRASVLEYDRDGNLLGVRADGLPPISGIALVPAPVAPGPLTAVPEPAAGVLVLVALAGRSRRGGR